MNERASESVRESECESERASKFSIRVHVKTHVRVYTMQRTLSLKMCPPGHLLCTCQCRTCSRSTVSFLRKKLDGQPGISLAEDAVGVHEGAMQEHATPIIVVVWSASCWVHPHIVCTHCVGCLYASNFIMVWNRSEHSVRNDSYWLASVAGTVSQTGEWVGSGISFTSSPTLLADAEG